MHKDRKIGILERQLSALRLRAAGATYDQIAAKLNYRSRSGAFKAVQSCMNRLRREGAQEARALELERLDTMQLGLWEKAAKGNTRAVRSVLSIMQRRASLLGLDAPTRYEIDNFLRSEDWSIIKATLTRVLERHPDAAREVAEALRGIGDE